MWLLLGWIFVGFGLIGLALPLMPTVPFLLVAAYCFERGSPKLHYWLLEHPQMGPPLKEWRSQRVIRWPAKLIATLGLTVSVGYTCFFSERPDWLKWTVGSIALLVVTFILTRKSRVT